MRSPKCELAAGRRACIAPRGLTYGGGKLYAGSEGGWVMAVDPRTGKVDWVAGAWPFGGKPPPRASGTSTTALKDIVALTYAEAGVLYVLRASRTCSGASGSGGRCAWTYDSDVRRVDVRSARVSKALARGIGSRRPADIAYLGGRLYVSDPYGNRIEALDPKTGVVRVLAGSGKAGIVDGPAAKARFAGPWGLTVWRGKLYVAEGGAGVVRVVDPTTGYVSTVAGKAWSSAPACTGPAGSPSIGHVRWLAAGGGSLFFDVRNVRGIGGLLAGLEFVCSLDLATKRVTRLGGEGNGLEGPGARVSFTAVTGVAVSGTVVYVSGTLAAASDHFIWTITLP